jgi:hypothetical protein
LAAQRFVFVKHGAGAGVDSVWEQEKLEVRKKLDAKRAAKSPASGACFVGQILQNIFDFSFLPCNSNSNAKRY